MGCTYQTNARQDSDNKKLITDYPGIPASRQGDSPELYNTVRRVNALISFYLHIPYPEDLPDEVWAEKYKQVEWLAEQGLLGVKTVNQ